MLLEGEEECELDEEEQKELAQKYGRRQLGTNADRYAEPDPELDSEGFGFRHFNLFVLSFDSIQESLL
jgi:hypothetical protein